MSQHQHSINMKNTRLTLLLVILLISTLTLTKQAKAQENRSMTVVPPSISLLLNPGERREGTLKMINDGDTPLTFNVNTQDFIVEDTKGTPTLIPPSSLNGKYSAASWIAVYPNSFIVEPHQKQVLNYYVQIPTNAHPGGHYAAVVYIPTTTATTNSTGAEVQTLIGSLFSITVNGPISELSQVTKFAAKSFQEYGPITIVTQIRNLGDLHTKPQGSIIISDIFGRVVGTLPLEAHNIFPDAARDYINTYNQTVLVGRFKATLLASYGVNNNIPLTATLYFWVFPWKATIIISLIILAIILGLLVWKKRKSEREPIDDDGTDMELPVV